MIYIEDHMANSLTNNCPTTLGLIRYPINLFWCSWSKTKQINFVWKYEFALFL